MRRWIIIAVLSTLAWAGPAHKCSATSSSSVSSLNCVLSSTSSNHLLILIADIGLSQAGGTTVTDSLGDTWNVAVTGEGNNLDMIFYSNTGGNSGNDTVTLNLAASQSFVGMYAAEYALNYTYDVQAYEDQIRQTTSGNFTTSGVTVTNDSELLISQADGCSASLNDVNWTSEGTDGVVTCGQWADRTLSTGTAGNSFTVSWTLSSANTLDTMVVAFTGTTPSFQPLHKCNKANTTTGASSFSCTLSSVGANHLIIAVFDPESGTFSSFSDGFTSSWSHVNSSTGAAGNTVYIGYALTGSNTGNDIITAATTGNITNGTLYAAEYGGGPWIFDTSSSATSTNIPSGNTLSTGNITTAKNGDLLITAAVCNSDARQPAASGKTTIPTTFVLEDHDASTGSGTAVPCTQYGDRTAGAAGSYSATWNMNGFTNGVQSTQNLGVILAAFKISIAPLMPPAIY